AKERSEIVEGDHVALLKSDAAQELPIAVIEIGGGGRIVVLQIAYLRQIRGVDEHEAGEGAGESGERDEYAEGNAADNLAAAAQDGWPDGVDAIVGERPGAGAPSGARAGWRTLRSSQGKASVGVSLRSRNVPSGKEIALYRKASTLLGGASRWKPDANQSGQGAEWDRCSRFENDRSPGERNRR